jgi:AAA15 family ATPase/GTPase
MFFIRYGQVQEKSSRQNHKNVYNALCRLLWLQRAMTIIYERFNLMSLAVESLETNKVKLDSLEIRGFRAFEHLRIEKLGRVNLITGKNNVGKTSLLEAVRLYAHKGQPELIWELLESRDEATDQDRGLEKTGINPFFSPNLKYLFYGRKEIQSFPSAIKIGSLNSPDDALSIGFAWYSVKIDEEGTRKIRILNENEKNEVENREFRLISQIGSQPKYFARPERLSQTFWQGSPSESYVPSCIFASANGLNLKTIGELWDSIALTDLEVIVLECLKLIASDIERVNIISGSARNRIPIVRIQSLDEPLPLRSLGEGMNRLFGIALALVNAKDGMLLIDEVESGLHYSVQSDVWRLIFATARRLNVQVFATTHSWDCIEAFQSAVQNSNDEDGLLIRLENKNDQIIPTLFDKRRLGIATRENIEVR